MRKRVQTRKAVPHTMWPWRSHTRQLGYLSRSDS